MEPNRSLLQLVCVYPALFFLASLLAWSLHYHFSLCLSPCTSYVTSHVHNTPSILLHSARAGPRLLFLGLTPYPDPYVG